MYCSIAWATAQDFSEPINIAWLGAINQRAEGVIEFPSGIFAPLHDPIFADLDNGIFNNVTMSIKATTFEYRNDSSLGSEQARTHDPVLFCATKHCSWLNLAHMEFFFPNPILGFTFKVNRPSCLGLIKNSPFLPRT